MDRPQVDIFSIESEKDKNGSKPADFEKAIAATGFGKFNYLLLVIAMPCCFSSVFDTTTMSFVTPFAECDLKLSLQDKGTLNAVTYAGMISSAILWGFLSDILGRKKLLVFGYIADAIFNLGCAFSQSLLAIMIFKFISGFIICGPFAVLMSYLSELNGLQYRSRIMLSTGIFFSIAQIILPSLAWLIIPQDWNLKISDSYEFHTWQIYLAVCALPALMSGIFVSFLPESPKFLMSRGRNEEALKVFKLLYRINNGESTEYPIKLLMNEKSENKYDTSLSLEDSNNLQKNVCSRFINGIRSGLSQMSVMLEKPHLKNSCLAYLIQFCILFGLNTFRLWVPQLFVIMTEFENDMKTGNLSNYETNLCTMVEYKVNKTDQIINVDVEGVSSIKCEATLESNMYINSLLMAIIALFAYLVVSFLINSIGNKNLLVYGLLISGVCGIGLYWSKTSLSTLFLSAGYVTVASISSTALVSSVVSMFPTSTRTMNVSLTMMFGRSGSLFGNLLFPTLMKFGCLPPFIMISLPFLISSCICRVLPKTVKKPLQ